MQAKKSLRERRREETARDIQIATLGLAETHGLDHVTTEMIAHEAGISVRTFFNYFGNKEAAVVGHPPPFPPEALEAFKNSNGRLIVDLHALVRSHAARIDEDRVMVQSVPRLAREYPKIQHLLDAAIQEQRDELVEALAARLDFDNSTLELFSDIAFLAGRRAIDLWIDGKADNLPDALDEVWARITRVAGMFSES